ncbi:MAG: beta-propeller domain-containing protein [Oscillospiraceae bacterium]|nr:beta-propeller domain-containing protein [Oscillospiraceae bacterium]
MNTILKKIIAGGLVTAIMLGGAVGCSASGKGLDKTLSPGVKKEDSIPAATTASSALSLVSLKNYKDVLEYIGYEDSDYYSYAKNAARGDVPAADEAESSTAAAPAPAEAPEADAATGDTGGGTGGGDYSDTNVQVEGVDESDIVKTDGKYIYILKDNRTLIIAKADGGNTSVISKTEISEDVREYSKDSNDYSYKSQYAENMYLSGDRVILLEQVYESSSKNDVYINNNRMVAEVFDVSDPKNPKSIGSAGQDGYLVNSRMVDGYIYLITNQYVYDYDEEDPQTYIPVVYRNGEAKILPIGDICIPQNTHSTEWLIISGIDAKTGEQVSSTTILGSGRNVYMKDGSLYVAGSEWVTDESQPRTEDQYKVIDYVNRSETKLFRFDAKAGQVDFAASGSIPGTMLNQFSMDEYKGNLRVVTTYRENSYTLYIDEKYDFTNYVWKDDANMTNGLYVLDEGLNVIGKIDGIAEEERVYSVRFDGDVGYFVTYKETDPLFAVDLSDPTNPKILSALKIPGFSQYLHVYGNGLLFGLGQSVNDDGTEGLKLSMFDTSDKTDVKEITTYVLKDTNFSPALYDHHACFISPEKNIIGFLVESYGQSNKWDWEYEQKYLFFSYENGKFVELGSVSLGDGWEYNARGLYIGDYIYVCSSTGIKVLNLNGLGTVKTVNF